MSNPTTDRLAEAITTGNLAEAYRNVLAAQAALHKVRTGDLDDHDAREAACGAQADLGSVKDAIAAMLSQRGVVVER